MIELEQAAATAALFGKAYHAATVPQIRAQFRRGYNEWNAAASDLKDANEEAGNDEVPEPYAIELAGAVVPAMFVYNVRGDRMMVRRMENGGQYTLHVEDPDRPTAEYVNLAGPASPVVVKL